MRRKLKQIGGKRPGAGRKPMHVEENIRISINKALDDDPEILTRIWKKLAEKAEKGSVPHAQLLFNYRFGKPTEHVEVRSTQMTITRVIVNE